MHINYYAGDDGGDGIPDHQDNNDDNDGISDDQDKEDDGDGSPDVNEGEAMPRKKMSHSLMNC